MPTQKQLRDFVFHGGPMPPAISPGERIEARECGKDEPDAALTEIEGKLVWAKMVVVPFKLSDWQIYWEA
jgi:hypothetical protein